MSAINGHFEFFLPFLENSVRHISTTMPPFLLWSKKISTMKDRHQSHQGGGHSVNDILRYTLRVNRVLFTKFRYIAESEGRSANKEIEQFMKRCVRNFEEEHGKIVLTDDEAISFYQDRSRRI